MAKSLTLAFKVFQNLSWPLLKCMSYYLYLFPVLEILSLFFILLIGHVFLHIFFPSWSPPLSSLIVEVLPTLLDPRKQILHSFYKLFSNVYHVLDSVQNDEEANGIGLLK